jgi:integrase
VNLPSATVAIEKSVGIGYTGEVELATPKTEAAHRTIPLAGIAVDALHRHFEAQDPPSLFVFPSRRGQLLRSTSFLHYHFHPVLDAAGLPRMPFHDLRHSAATLLKEMDVDLLTVSRVLGHASPATTMQFYGHVTPRLMAGAAEKMDALLGTVSGAESGANGSQMAAKAIIQKSPKSEFVYTTRPSPRSSADRAEVS